MPSPEEIAERREQCFTDHKIAAAVETEAQSVYESAKNLQFENEEEAMNQLLDGLLYAFQKHGKDLESELERFLNE